MIEIKRLCHPELIDEACYLLYDIYIKECHWKFAIDNPSQLQIIIKNNRKLLVDRFTDKAIWFGAFDKDTLVGCIRLCGVDKNSKFEIEGYSGSKILATYLKNRRCMELTRAAINKEYRGTNILMRLYLAVTEYCHSLSLSIFGCANNIHVKNELERIEFPLKIENAFKYEQTDTSEVNFYFASYENGEMDNMLQKLNKLPVKLQKPTRLKYANALNALEFIAETLPAPIYWHNVEGVVLGINDHCLKGMGMIRENVLGKTPYQFYPKEIAEYILKHNKLVMQTGNILSQEEVIYDSQTGKAKYFVAIKAPLYDDDEKVIGIVGSSIDITAEKEAERLKLENETQKIHNDANRKVIAEQEKFGTLVKSIFTDLQAPLLDLQTTVMSKNSISSEEIVSVQEAISKISSITNQLLVKYGKSLSNEATQIIIVEAMLSDIVAEKSQEFINLPIQFILNCDEEYFLTCINIQPFGFKQMLFNLIDNAITSINNKPGTVTLTLITMGGMVGIFVEDTGIGMSDEQRKKLISNDVSFNENSKNKKDYTQVHELLQNNHGKLNIFSKLNHGTSIIMGFPEVDTPNWIAKSINLMSDSIVIILDEDKNIHEVWALKFEELLQENHELKLEYFTNVKTFIDFLHTLSADTQAKIVLLTASTFSEQELTILQVIAQEHIRHATLITNQYTSLELRDEAIKHMVKLLPKSILAKVKIQVHKKLVSYSKIVDFVWLEDDQELVNKYVNNYYNNLQIDLYHDPLEFLSNFYIYPLDMPIIIDDFYAAGVSNILCNITGFDIALELHNKGYHKLFLLSGANVSPSETPPYLKILKKDNQDIMQNLDKL